MQSNMSKRKALYIVLSLVVAMAIWVYVDISGDRNIKKTFTDVPVEFLDEDTVLAERGLMLWCDKEFLDVKVRSAVFTAEARDGRLWGVAECQVVGQLSPEELTGLKDYLTGQAADGVGEGLEQQAIRVDGGELYVHMWQPEGWSIQTEAEQFGLTQAQGMTMGGMSRG